MGDGGEEAPDPVLGTARGAGWRGDDDAAAVRSQERFDPRAPHGCAAVESTPA